MPAIEVLLWRYGFSAAYKANRHLEMLPEVLPGQLYGYRVNGPYEPQQGHRFNSNKLLLDPYAKGIGRDVKWADEVFGYRLGDPESDLSFDDRDSAAYAPLAMVIDPAFTWGDDRPPRTPWHKTIVYELHVKGFTQLHQLCLSDSEALTQAWPLSRSSNT